MGLYLNSKKPHTIYKNVVEATYFVDKTAMIEELLPLVESEENRNRKDNHYICITRPRRFGKTVAASMIASYFSKGHDSRKIFEKLHISKNDKFENHLNKYNVIYIAFNELPKDCKNYQQYIDRIQERLLSDLRQKFANVKIDKDIALWDAFNNIYELEDEIDFIFVLDEWDYIFHRNFVKENDKTSYIDFLSNLLKDQPYVKLAYMTGILPIAKYSSGSELNMFYEYTMATEEKYSEFFGFTESEVDKLFTKYLTLNEQHKISREDLRMWYNGYHTQSGGRVYNPRSVIASLTNNNLGNYWTSSIPHDEIFRYIEQNIDIVRDDIAVMISGIAIQARVREYAVTSMNTKDEILSTMVVYGFLSYENGYISIPNKEITDKFNEILMKNQH